MTTTYLEILMDKLFACSELNEDLRLRARAELREIQKQRGILAICGPKEKAWDVPYSKSNVRALAYWAELKDADQFEKMATSLGGALLVPQHHFDARHYSEVVAL